MAVGLLRAQFSKLANKKTKATENCVTEKREGHFFNIPSLASFFSLSPFLPASSLILPFILNFIYCRLDHF